MHDEKAVSFEDIAFLFMKKSFLHQIFPLYHERNDKKRLFMETLPYYNKAIENVNQKF